MDERAGRAVAKEKGLRVTGTAAIIGLAKKQDLIPSARAAFERLHNSDFRISATVINLILDSVNELESWKQIIAKIISKKIVSIAVINCFDFKFYLTI